MNARKKILHVEDDSDWRKYVLEALGDDFDVYSVPSLQEAFDLYKSIDFSLAILDISLIPEDSQDDSGEFLLKALEGLSILPGKRIVILSAYLTGAYQERTRRYFKYYRVLDAIPKQSYDSREFKKIVEDALNDFEK